ncbi:MAG: hypothetical protein ACK55I_25955, partial [bacterium]
MTDIGRETAALPLLAEPLRETCPEVPLPTLPPSSPTLLLDRPASSASTRTLWREFGRDADAPWSDAASWCRRMFLTGADDFRTRSKLWARSISSEASDAEADICDDRGPTGNDDVTWDAWMPIG